MKIFYIKLLLSKLKKRFNL